MIRKSRALVGVMKWNSSMHPIRSVSHNPTVLQEVGRLQKPLDPNGTAVSYKTGQLFLHKQLGYRGVILVPWKTKVFESINAPTQPVKDGDGEETMDILCGDVDQPNHIERSPELFYNVLVDASDSSYVRASIDGVSFLGRDSSNDLIVFTMPGVDLVHNKDVVPYRQSLDDDERNGRQKGDGEEKEFPPETTMTEILLLHNERENRPAPIQHELFAKFFQPDFYRESKAEPAYVATTAFRKWKKRNSRWLKPETAYRAENAECGVHVTVIPFFMGSHKDTGEMDKLHWWRYLLCIENVGTKSLLIKSRTWSISTQKGTFDKRIEVGLEGRHTVLSPWNPCTQITCYCSLEAPTGSIWGQLDLVDGEGKNYECPIPHFTLKRSPGAGR